MNSSDPAAAYQELFALGLDALRAADLSSAALLLTQALGADATQPAAYANRGIALHRLGRAAEALADYERAVALDPRLASTYLNRSQLLRDLGRLEDALTSVERAIALAPSLAEAHSQRGIVLRELGRHTAALASYDTALALRPRFAAALCNRGDVLRLLDRVEEALAACDQAIALQPDLAAAHHNRGLALRALERREAALQAYDRALALLDAYPEAHISRGNVLRELGRLDEAMQSCERAVALAPRLAAAYGARGMLHQQLEQPDAALADYDAAIALQPDCVEAHCNRGALLVDLQRLDEAGKSLDEAIRLDGDFVPARVNRALAALLCGDFKVGWEGYEWRWRHPESRRYLAHRSFGRPHWDGTESVAGKRMLLHAEQGLGDTLQFCRYAPLVAELGARVILEVPNALLDLLSQLDGVAEIVAEGTPLPPFDLHCPLLSLPFALRTTLDTIPAGIPYLAAPADRRQRWSHRLGAHTRLRVGVVWSGGMVTNRPDRWAVNARRNVPLALLAPLANDAIEFFSLQKGAAAEAELARLTAAHWSGPRLIDLTAELHDFADTAALVEQLDLVIAVDTSTAHLAGALGKPVWLMNRFATCWRWLLDRNDSPWYPTLRLYRQDRPGDWDGVVTRVSHDLRRLAHAPARAPAPAPRWVGAPAANDTIPPSSSTPTPARG